MLQPYRIIKLHRRYIIESRIFIREANSLIKDINDHELLKMTRSPEAISASSHDLQIRINQLFAAMQNPSLTTANLLCDRAVSAGFSVSNKIMHEIEKANAFWDNSWV